MTSAPRDSSASEDRYLPPGRGSLRGRLHETFLRLAYDVWRRQILRLGRWSKSEQLDILECGCGPGLLLKFLETWFPSAQLTGLDLAPRLLGLAARNTARTRFVQASAEQIPLGDDAFDVVVALHLVEHLREPGKFFAEASRVLSPGGLLLIATPNPIGLGARLMGKAWAGWSDPSHISMKSPREWRKMLDASGFKVIEDGTTGLSGLPAFRVPPLAFVNWLVLFLVGKLPWGQGEAYVCAAVRAGAIAESSRQDQSDG
jgi:SAM-dependent methyltransferase